MQLTEQTKQKIIDEYNTWFNSQYGDKSLEERQELGAFFTPPELSIQMIEKFDNLDGTILDPCMGAGGLLAACIIAGADPENIYGIELDKDILEVCKNRLVPMGVPEWHLHQGDALLNYCYDFSPEYKYPKYSQTSLWDEYFV